MTVVAAVTVVESAKVAVRGIFATCLVVDLLSSLRAPNSLTVEVSPPTRTGPPLGTVDGYPSSNCDGFLLVEWSSRRGVRVRTACGTKMLGLGGSGGGDGSSPLKRQ